MIPMPLKCLVVVGSIVVAPVLAADPAGDPSPQVADLLSKLANPLPAVRIAATEGLGKIGQPASAAVPALLRSLEDPEVVVRNNAAWALGKIGSPSGQIVPALAAKVEAAKEIWTVRHNAALSLSWIGQPAVPALRKGLDSADGWTRAYSGDALYRIAPQGPDRARVVEVMIGLLSDQDPGLRAFGVATAGTIGPPAAAAAPHFVRLLDDPDANVRASALNVLPRLGPAAAVAIPRLLRVLKESKEDAARLGATVGLSELGGDDAALTTAFVAALGDKAGRVSSAAAQALGKRGEVTVPALLDVLKSENESLRKAALDGFSFMGTKAGDKAAGVATVLIPLLQQDRSYEIRFRSAVALGVLGVRSASVTSALTGALKDDNEIVRVNARDALQRLGVAVPEKSSASAGKAGPG